MLRSLIKGVGLGAGLSVGQQIAGAFMQNIALRTASASGDITCACGQINTADSRFCGECGGCLVSRCNLQEGIKCQCGFTNAQGQKFCSECGTKLT
jgi:hypothetical protein